MSTPTLLQPDTTNICCGCPSEPCAGCSGCEEIGDTLYVTISGITSGGCQDGLFGHVFANSGTISADGLNAVFTLSGSYSTGWLLPLSSTAVGSTSQIYDEPDCEGDSSGEGASQYPPFATYNNIGVTCSDGVLTITLTFGWFGTAPTLIYIWQGSAPLNTPMALSLVYPGGSTIYGLSGGTATVSQS